MKRSRHMAAMTQLLQYVRRIHHRTRMVGGLLFAASLLAAPWQGLYAEGSKQVGLTQPLYEYGATQALLLPMNRPLYVDIASAGEVINFSLCGNANSDQLRVQLRNPVGTIVLDQTLSTATTGVGRVTCTDTFSAPLGNPLKYTTTNSGTYEVRLYNNNATNGVFKRFDITVTPNTATLPDPRLTAGRLWAYSWAYNTGSYAKSFSTDADYYSLTPGNEPGTNFIWKLDLNKFAGYVYEIVSNGIGVDAPHSGISVPTAGNNLTPAYPVYVGYPVVAAGPLPSQPPVVGNFRFEDDEGVDAGISPGFTTGIQDSGTFYFDTDGVVNYAIVIDTNQDSIYGAGDVLLLGPATPGTNGVTWDGRDNNDAILPVGTYNARLQLRAGEYHFVASDAETSGGDEPGLTIYQALSGGGTANTLVFWDDETVLGGTSTLPAGLLAGRHTWGNFTSSSFGNARYIDTYTYGGVTTPTVTSAVITPDDTPLPPDTQITGRVWSDANHNGIIDGGESGITGATVVLHDTVGGTCQGVQTDASGDYVFTGVFDGSYAIIEAAGESVPVPGSCPPAAIGPAGHVFTTASSHSVTMAGANISGKDFGNFHGSRFEGTVFEDNGSGAATAHDGNVTGNETGLPGMPVVASNGATLDTTTTDASGQFILWIGDAASGANIDIIAATPGSYISVSKADGGAGDTAAATALDQISITPVSGQVYSGIAFGDAREPAFAPDHSRSASPGSTLSYPHTFTAYSSGTVSFSTAGLIATPNVPGWNAVLHDDSNCSGTLEQGEPVHTLPIAMDADVNNQACLLVRVFVPASAPANAQYAVTLAATFNYDATSLVTARNRTDLTTVGDSSLVLVKVVDKPTAQPGELLTYTITYTNAGSEALSNIVIDDNTPGFTTFNSASCLLPLPANLTGCAVSVQPAAGATGPIQWSFNPGDTLQSGSSGQLQFLVTVDN
ncbi:MAG: SdrD B-like domain-containing protein [Gammaproteobacteria bacterium]